MRILVFTALYPNAAQPQHGVFVENRLRKLLATGKVSAKVVAPVPWFPFKQPAFGSYAKFASVPEVEERHGIPIVHPRYFLPPRIGMNVAPLMMYLGAKKAVRDIQRSGFDFDVIDAHYFYPDGVAAILLGRALGKPVCITGRGTDLNLIPQKFALPRRMIQWASREAAGMITVCQSLKDDLAAAGGDSGRVVVLRNGVDLQQFVPMDRDAERARLGLTGDVILSVGGLIPRKGHDLAIRAMVELPAATLVIAGQGPELERLQALAKECGVADRVRFLGQVSHEALPPLYGAADVMLLASAKEGWANVLLEAMACGTPVVATRAGGTPEVVTAPTAGIVVQDRSSPEIAKALRFILANRPVRAETRAFAEQFSWSATTNGQLALLEDIASRKAASR
jgi:glycosyltransferase involved in cell wall biosynthesis